MAAFDNTPVYVGDDNNGEELHANHMRSFRVQFAAYASRPAAGNQNVCFVSTNGKAGTGIAVPYMYRDDGAAWQDVGYLADPATFFARIATGSYTGDGATSLAITGVGFSPKFVLITQRLTSATSLGVAGIGFTSTAIIDDHANGMWVVFEGGGGVPATQTDGIISLDADGFTVDDAGADADPNSNTIVYNYVAIG